MAKVILFDFWGTIVENGVWSPVKQVKNILRIDLPFSEYVVRMEKAMMTSQFSELKEAFVKVGEEFGITISPRQMENLIGTWNKSWMLAWPYKEAEAALAELQKDYRLVLVSNTDCFSIQKVLDKYGLKKYFEQIFLSYERGKIKTDPEMFEDILKELDVKAEECVMVGDSLQSDMLPAQQQGMMAVLVDRRGTREFPVKIKSLEELKLLLEREEENNETEEVK